MMTSGKQEAQSCKAISCAAGKHCQEQSITPSLSSKTLSEKVEKGFDQRGGENIASTKDKDSR